MEFTFQKGGEISVEAFKVQVLHQQVAHMHL